MPSRRLYIDFGGKVESFNETDIYLTDSEELFSAHSSYSQNIYKIDFEMLIQDESIPLEVDFIFSHFDLDIDFLKNTFYSKGYLHLRSLIEQVAELISKNAISTLVLNGGCKSYFYGFHYGEGEARSRFFNREYFYNYFIFLCFKNVVTVTWNKEDSYILLKLFRTLRNIVMPTTFVLVNSYRSFIKVFKRESIPVKRINKHVIIMDMDTQYSFFNVRAFNKCSIISHRVLNIKNSDKLEAFSFRDFLKLITCIRTVLSHRDCEVSINVKDLTLKISVAEILRSLLFSYVSFVVRTSQINYLLSKERYKNVSKLITAMTYDIDISSVNHAANQFNLVHDNYQAVTNRRVCYPVLNIATNYYLNDVSTFDFYRAKSDSFRYLVPDFKIIPSHRNIERCINAVFFAQPDIWADRSIAELTELCTEIEKCNVNISLTLKLHYRQNKIEDFLVLANRYKFLELSDANVSATDLLQKSDLAFGLTSSVLFEALILGCMSCILNISNTFCVNNYASSICTSVNFVITEKNQLESFFYDFSKQYKEYFTLRAQYISQIRAFSMEKST